MAHVAVHDMIAGMGHPAEERHQKLEAKREGFCRRYGLDASKAVVTGGFRKDVLLLPDEVYLFPFSVASDTFIARETAFLKRYSGEFTVTIPRFIRSFTDRDFCDFDIRVISRVQGSMLCDVIETYDRAETTALFTGLARTIAGWHAIAPDAKLYAEHGTTFSPLSGLPDMKRWLSSFLSSDGHKGTSEWLRARLIEEAAPLGIDTAFLNRPSLISTWDKALGALNALPQVILHGDMHDGQMLLDGRRTEITGVIDWDNFCTGSPVLDFSTSKWFPQKIWQFREGFRPMREEMWQVYLDQRGIKGQWKGGLNLFLAMTEVVRVLCEKTAPKVWMTRGPFKDGLKEYLGYLEDATSMD